MRRCAAPARASITIAAVSLFLAACGGSSNEGADSPSSASGGDVESIKIAAPFGLTGPVGPFAEPHVPALELAIKKINETGGIKSLGGAPLELLLQDSQSDPAVATRLLREMKADGAVIAVAPFASGIALAAKPVLADLDLPLVVPSFAKPLTDDNGDQVIWRVVATDAEIANDAMDFIGAARESDEIAVESIGIVSIAGGAGPPFADAVTARAEEMDIEVVDVRYDPAETRDFGPVVAQLRKADVDLVTGFQYTQDAIQFAESLLLQDWRPSEGFVWLGGAQGEYAFREALGAETQGWMDAGFGSTSGCDAMTDFAAEYEKETGEPLIGLSPAAPATIAVIADALERAGSTEPADIKAALAETELDFCEGLYSLAGGVQFNERGDNAAFQPTIVQHEGDSELVPVWPEAVSAREPVWPAK
jgi:branched-chain amino acid transport system substrate-binding protein